MPNGGLGPNPYEEREPPEKEPKVPTREEFWRAYPGEPYPPEVPPEKPTLPAIPPEGIKYTVKGEKGEDIELHILEDFEYVGTERTLVSPNYPVYHGKTQIGTFMRETGEFVSQEPTWWEKTLGVGAKTLEYAFLPFAVVGQMTRDWWERLQATAPWLSAEEREQRLGELEADIVRRAKEEGIKQILPGGTKYEEFRALPWYQQIAFELPAWIALGASGLSAIKGRAALAPIPGIAPKVARVALVPAAVYEKAVATGLKYGIGIPLKAALTGSRKAFEKALDLGLDKWLVRQGIRGDQANRVIRFFLEKNNRWLYRQAETSVKDKLAKKIAATQAGRVAANDVVKAAEPMLRDAVKSVTGKELVPITPAVVKPLVVPPIKPPKAEWARFWIETQSIGLTSSEVHEALGVASVKDWIAKGNTLEQALMKVRGQTPATPEQAKAVLDLGKEKMLVSAERKWSAAFDRLVKGITGKDVIKEGAGLKMKKSLPELTSDEANLLAEALGGLEIKYGKPPKIPTTVGLITKEFADKIPFLKEVSVLERVRPTRQVFEKMGLRAEVFESAFEAEQQIYEALQAFRKEFKPFRGTIGKVGSELDVKLWRAIEHPKEMAKLTSEERKIAEWGKKLYDEWADKLNLPASKRRNNYITHTFEADISQMLKARHPLDPALIKAMDYITPKTVFNPYLQKRLGQTLGLKESFLSSINAYEARALKVFYYEPLIQKIRIYQQYLPPNAARYLKDYIGRITNKPLPIDREVNQLLKDVGDKIYKLNMGAPFDKLANFLQRGNVAGLVAYQYTSALYFLWLGFKPTSAIRNLSQNFLTMAEVGPVGFVRGLALVGTSELKSAHAKSLVLRSRRQAYMPGIDATFVSRWTDKVREISLKMFRTADKINVLNAFNAGYAEARLKGLPRDWAIKRGDEVAADTQYIYTRLGGAAWSQPSVGRILSPLTTWPENWLELMARWVKGRPSYVFREYAKATGKKVEPANWLLRRKALLLYATLLGTAYYAEQKTRLRAFEYTGWSSLRYLADILSGELPALSIPGSVAKVAVGSVTDNERLFKEGWNQLKPTRVFGIANLIDRVTSGDADWQTMLVYLKGKDFAIRQLEDSWQKEFDTYYESEDHYEYRRENPQIDARLFITSRVERLQTDGARQMVTKIIKEHKLDTELIKGYAEVFETDTVPVLDKSKIKLGALIGTSRWGDPIYFTTVNFASEVNKLENLVGRNKLEKDAHPLAIEYLRAEDQWQAYYDLPPGEARNAYRKQFPEIEADLFFWGKLTAFQNPNSKAIVLSLMDKYGISYWAISGRENLGERVEEKPPTTRPREEGLGPNPYE